MDESVCLFCCRNITFKFSCFFCLPYTFITACLLYHIHSRFHRVLFMYARTATEIISGSQKLSEINDFREALREQSGSNLGSHSPKRHNNTFSAYFQQYLVAFVPSKLLFGALNSAVSVCSGAVCGNLCGQKRFPSVSRWAFTGAGQEAFLVSSCRIVTLVTGLCKWFLRRQQLTTCGAIYKEEEAVPYNLRILRLSKLKILPELFGKILVFTRFDDYNYIVVL